MLTFDPVEHCYTWRGRRVPSVTQVIASALGNPFANVPEHILERARMLGSATHLARHLDDAGQLDEASIHPDVRPRLEAWRAFRREFRATVLMSEKPLYSATHGFAGTPDVVLAVDAAPSWIALVDVKTGLPTPAAALQTSAYEHLVACELGLEGTPIRRFAMRALPSGRYGMQEFTAPGDWRDFLACLAVMRLKERIATT